MMRTVPDHRALIEALRRPPSTRDAAIDALADVSLLRAALDEFERGAIDKARAGGASWAEVAAALGLASRQAAEQRRARLGGGAGDRSAAGTSHKRQHFIDSLRQSLANLYNLLENPQNGPESLARQTIAIALDAPPGQLIDLAKLVVDDLRHQARTNPRTTAALSRVAALTSRSAVPQN
jgi:hypothetical protein